MKKWVQKIHMGTFTYSNAQCTGFVDNWGTRQDCSLTQKKTAKINVAFQTPACHGGLVNSEHGVFLTRG